MPDEVRLERRDLIMAAQQPIAFGFNASLVGRELDVLIDGPSDRGPGWFTGRTYADAPDVDGVAFVLGPNLEPGDLASCEIVASEGYDLIAHVGSRPPRKRRSRPKPRKRPASLLNILN